MTIRKEIVLHFITVAVAFIVILTVRWNQEGQTNRHSESIASMMRVPPKYSQLLSTGDVLIVVSPTCQYCARSMPFYNKLTQILEETSSSKIVFAINDQSPARFWDAQKQILDSHQIQYDSLAMMSFEEIGVSAVPGVLYIGDKGEVTNYWRGQLQEEQEDDLLKVVGAN